MNKEGRMKSEEGRMKSEEGRMKREEGRGKGKREEYALRDCLITRNVG